MAKSKEKFDFAGWASKNDIRCSDGRTIRRDAFAKNDGQTVPLVWQHQHNDPTNVLGHALLTNRPEGMWMEGSFNGSPLAQHAKMLLEHGDITSLSIWANDLVQNGGDVLHGNIREVSLVLSPANPGASIVFPVLAHGDGVEEEDTKQAIITMGEAPEYISHADEEEPPASGKEEPKMAENEKTVKDVFDEMTEEQKNVVYFMIGKALEDANGGDDDDDDEEDDEEEDDVKHNVFDATMQSGQPYLSHSDFQEIIRDAKSIGNLKDAVIAHMQDGVLSHAVYNHNPDGTQGTEQTYGIADIDYLFPDARNLDNPPQFIQRDMDWVKEVAAKAHHTPFSRIKSTFADITNDEARARGYAQKAKLKKEEVFSLSKRTTSPTTVYKKQKMDRDDQIDITDFDVVAWIKAEMRMMLEEELSRAILIGDGRLASDDDHIDPNCIRPIWTDSSLFTIQVDVPQGADSDKTAKNFVRAAIKARKNYRGSGNPTLFTTEDFLTDLLLLEDGIGHPLYDSVSKLATVLRVSKIVTVPVMENQQRNGKTLMGIIVNMQDYNVGADKGGAVSLFDDFNLDYNQLIYLIETRCSGALVKPFSAIALEMTAANSGGDDSGDDSGDDTNP